ncbi:DUF1217 domain-containing protein [Pseudoprimorskyibacter insulae]|uniref:Flagellar protein n=1 Tax=Pseudoprimorskyibacter insulae TaxID=1695997 RepID=A0A2R8AZD1_9RHOB|nr:DUF1217 domain-containing protein [Pseudoprimorskyibacter insulae]SPF81209.1 hypothetical protein PRI8871_03031 [Pseudoprimorskyibacter insulae]
MTFQPFVSGGGLAGWYGLKSSLPRQMAAMSSSPEMQTDAAYLREKMPALSAASDVTDDYRLKKVVLGAFDMLEDIGSRFFVKKLIGDGIANPQALANRLQDARYKDLAGAMVLSSTLAGTDAGAAHLEGIVLKYQELSFERAVGDQNADFRVAMGLERQLPELTSSANSNNAAWFRVMGTKSLRTAFETVLGLPSSFSQLDLDKQLEIFKSKAETRFGTDQLSELAKEDMLPKLSEAYIVQRQISDSGQSGVQSIALQLLRGI